MSMFQKLMVLFFLIFIGWSCAEDRNSSNAIDVGVARVDITPRVPVRLSGFAARGKEETHQVLSKIHAKAIAIGNDKQQPTVFITVDLLGIQWSVTNKIVEALAKKTGLKPEQIAIFASHTHGGPEIGNFINHLQCRGNYPVKFNFSDSLIALPQLLHLAEFNEFLVSKLEEVATEALKDRKPALMSWGQSSASFSENRRPEGGPVDQSLPVLRVTNLQGDLRAVFFNYACHGISLGEDVNAVHGDWMGEAQNQIEARYPGAVAMMAVGCAGDSHPVKRNNIEFMRAYGKEILDSVSKLITSDLTPLVKPPVGNMTWVRLPFNQVPSVSELISFTADTTIKGYYARLALERVLRGEELPKELNYPLQVWNFDEKMAMINMGGEVVVDYSRVFNEKYGKGKIWINAYANDVSCYIPSRRIIKEGGYEGETSMYWYNKPAPFSDSVEERIINAVDGLMPASFK